MPKWNRNFDGRPGKQYVEDLDRDPFDELDEKEAHRDSFKRKHKKDKDYHKKYGDDRDEDDGWN